MTNLLHRLARRTLSAQRTVRPVTPPLFLPVRQEAAAPATPSTTTAQTAAPQQPQPQPQQRAPRAPRSHRKGAQPRSRHRDADAESSPAAPAPPTQTRSVTDPPLQERVIINEPPAAEPATPELTPTIEASVTASQANLLQTEVRTVIENAAATEPVAPAPSTRVAEPARTSLEPRPQRAAPAAEKPRPRRQREAAAPPTIEVTIGRIEVRTQPPPARRPARKPRQPTLTLEAYAAERKAGRR